MATLSAKLAPFCCEIYKMSLLEHRMKRNVFLICRFLINHTHKVQLPLMATWCHL